MPGLHEVLDGAKDDAKALARDTLVRIKDWIASEVEAKESLDGVSLSSSSLDEALAGVAEVNESLDAKLEAKQQADEIVSTVLKGASKIALAAAVAAL